MTEREINEKISEWIGRPCTCVETGTFGDDDEPLLYWGSCAMHHMGGLPTPYVTSDRCAVELLTVLIERGHQPCLYYRLNSWVCNINGSLDGGYLGLAIKPTIAAAISMAIVSLIDKLQESI